MSLLYRKPTMDGHNVSALLDPARVLAAAGVIFAQSASIREQVMRRAKGKSLMISQIRAIS